MKRHKQSGSARPERRSGPSQRQLRVGEAVRHALYLVLERGAIHDPDLDGVSITVSEVVMSPDLRVAKAHVMPLGGADGGRVVEALNRAAPAVRHLLAPTMTLKFVPSVRFELDTTFDYAGRIGELLEQARARRPADDPDGGDGA